MPADPYTETVNRVIRALRDERRKQGISQEKLAAKAGLSRTGVRHVESEQYRPTLNSLLRIAGALGMNLPGLVADAEKESGAQRRAGS